MNAITRADAPIASAPSAFALMPGNMDQAARLADIMSKSSLVPSCLQGKPADCFLVIEQALRWNMSPFAVAQCTSVVKGRLNFEGKLVAAAVQSSGILNGRLDYDYEGTGDGRTIIVTGFIRGSDKPREVKVCIKDVRTDNEQWRKQPDQQLAYSGTRTWARRWTPEVMLGVYSPEEFEEAPSEPREVPSTVVEEQRPAPASSMREHAQTLETWPLLAPNGDLVRIAKRAWPRALERAIGQMESVEALREYRAAMGEHLAAIAEGDAEIVAKAEETIEARLLALADASFPADEGGPP